MSQGLPELASDQRRGQCRGSQRYSFRDIKYNRCPGLSFFIQDIVASYHPASRLRNSRRQSSILAGTFQ